MQITRIGIRLSLTAVILLGGLIIISLFTTSPDELGPYGITLWFITLFIAVAGALTTLLYWYRKSTKSSQEGARLFRQPLRHGILGSIWLTSILALNSLKQLSLRDIVLITLLLVLVEFYMRRGRQGLG